MVGNFGLGEIWRIVFQTAFGEINFGESLPMECAPSYIIALQL